MAVADKLTILQRTPLFRRLNQRQIEQVGKRFVERTYAPGEKIVTQGKGGEGFFREKGFLRGRQGLAIASVESTFSTRSRSSRATSSVRWRC